MKFSNNDNNYYILQVYLKEDSDLFILNYEIDGKKDEIYLSNKGHHSIYLGQFHEFIIDDSNKVNCKLVKKVNDNTEFYENFGFVVSNDQPTVMIVYNKPYLYEDLQENNGPNLYNTIKRILNLTDLYRKNNDQALLDAIIYSLDFIFNNWYTGKTNYSGNWWFYEIGVPRCINEILYILRDKVNKATMFKYLNAERFYIPSARYIFYRRNYPNIYREEATCANLAENIYICTLREILHENNDALNELFEQVSAVIKSTDTHDGFYLDGSFIQHGNIPYNASYGEVLLKSITRIMEIFKLLGYDCTNYINRIEKILLNSYQPFLYDGYALECVRGRAVSRMKLNARYSYTNIIDAIKKMNSIFPSPIFESILNTEKDRNYSTYSKAFNYIDRYITRNNDYLISINLNSNYIANYEAINGENIIGDYSSNYTYDLIYNTHKSEYEYPRALYANRYYRNGSTNTFNKEEPNKVYQNNITAGVDIDNILLTCWHQNTDITGYFTKCYLGDSLVCIGTDINSEYDYVSTIYNFTNDYVINNNIIDINDIKIKCNNKFIVKSFNEVVNPRLNNINEPDININYKVNRIYLENPKQYEYQIYPKYFSDVVYNFYDLGGAHIIKYNNYLIINSFINKKYCFEDLEFEGVFSGVIKYSNDIKFIVSTGKRDKQDIKISLNNFNKNFIINDELVHEFIL